MSQCAKQSTGPARSPTPANRLCLDYREQARRLGPPPTPIIDAHTHIHGVRAARIYREARDLFGVATTYSMSFLEEYEDLVSIFGDTIRFIAHPQFTAKDRVHAHGPGYLLDIKQWHARSCRIVKFWTAPRSIDYASEAGDPDLMRLDGKWRREQMELAASLGMMFMAHIADPDTWFATKYADARRYGSKEDQYIPFRDALRRYENIPWIAAHMGGWPEDLAFLDRLLDEHPNLYLDSSATKWMVREISKHPRDALLAFLEKHRGRILFGSDIVTMESHLSDDAGPMNIGAQASSEQDAFDLYASRYFALRTLWESDCDGESPIADPDLAMIEPDRHDAMSAPRLRGKHLPRHLLHNLYAGAAHNLLDRWHAKD